MKKIFLFIVLLFAYGCIFPSANRATLPDDEFLVIAHRGASAYAPGHTLAAYELAQRMGTDYIELDLHLTKDGKLVALHNTVVNLRDKEHLVANINFDELQLYFPGNEFNKNNPEYALPEFERLPVVDFETILDHFGDTVNYYIEIKSPKSYPGIEKKVVRQLRKHDLIGRDDLLPKVIIQSFGETSLRKIFAMEPSIPLIKLYAFDKIASLSKKERQQLVQYAAGVGVNAKTVTNAFVETMHQEGLHVHPYTVNNEKMMRTLKELGVNGLFTDKPDLAIRVKKNKSSMDSD
ncbi:glycerophosphodiester phosphodiesterase family protein [Filibacter tadaridae]|uniref:Glycerophosphoryl diester phosphodiesterase n=1 Tax=Filibacter tadaridae TaxID=2483811 RepID=A0A3P5X8E8_9BACL|nr:glycerophosphodiester phosphodiesterase family protein [Filibacter tadaridae]VDC24709.1 Glycerophosphoryl diester phosphodiesterase precursor [Filibacter tadaridae]